MKPRHGSNSPRYDGGAGRRWDTEAEAEARKRLAAEANAPLIAAIEGARMKPQNVAVLALLRQQGRLGVTPALARERVGTDRLAARVSELRADGHRIETTTLTTATRKHVARYVLHEAQQLSFVSHGDARPVVLPAVPVALPRGTRRGAIRPLPGVA